jgi:hypothetical protein
MKGDIGVIGRRLKGATTKPVAPPGSVSALFREGGSPVAGVGSDGRRQTQQVTRVHRREGPPPTVREHAYRRAVQAAATAAVVREAEGIALDAALAIIQRGTAALLPVLDGLPEDVALARAAAAWLACTAYRLLQASDDGIQAPGGRDAKRAGGVDDGCARRDGGRRGGSAPAYHFPTPPARTSAVALQGDLRGLGGVAAG